jgi:radical SAM superfamily enzyme YgiQ (UPF0313 family)
MRYFGRIFRPPSEAGSLIIQATIGCSHNKCTFCSMYKEKQFRVRKVEDVIDDFKEARKYYPRVDRIFLADGDALILKPDKLIQILNAIKEIFPECQRVGSYGSPKSILIKSAEELRAIKEAGLGIVYLGLESGSDEVLSYINKGETADEIVRAGIIVREAGMILSVTAISGMGGKRLWKEHAVKTGEAFSRMKPHYIGLLTLMLEGDIPLIDQVESGEFELLTPKEVALETLHMLKHMDCEGSVFRSNHASNYLSLKGNLNRDRESMIQKLEAALEGEVGFKREEYRLL